MESAAQKNHRKKYRKLYLGLLMDFIGMLSYFLPVFGFTTDVVWAPISGFVLYKLYGGTVGKVAGIIGFLEELSPGLDFIPSFTLTWIYEYWVSRDTQTE